MGFGWLLIGYFISTFMTINAVGWLARLIGYGVILFAAGRLRQYHVAFGWLMIGTVLMLLSSAALACSNVTDLLYNNLLINQRMVSDQARSVIGHVDQGVSFVFHGALLYAVRAIAKDTEDEKISNNAIRNFVFICAYYLVYVISYLPVPSIRACEKELALIAWLIYLAWVILNLLLIGSCYARICDENDQEMQQKPSRFEFVNRFREESERRAQKARQADEAYRREKREKRRKRRKK